VTFGLYPNHGLSRSFVHLVRFVHSCRIDGWWTASAVLTRKPKRRSHQEGTDGIFPEHVPFPLRRAAPSSAPPAQPYLEDILPKKGNVTIAKCKDRVSLICCDGVPLFFQQRDGLIFPTLRILHKCKLLRLSTPCV